VRSSIYLQILLTAIANFAGADELVAYFTQAKCITLFALIIAVIATVMQKEYKGGMSRYKKKLENDYP
jgi:hypothetical protein